MDSCSHLPRICVVCCWGPFVVLVGHLAGAGELQLCNPGDGHHLERLDDGFRHGVCHCGYRLSLAAG